MAKVHREGRETGRSVEPQARELALDRRQFVQRASGLFVAAAFGAGCKDVSELGELGRVRLSIAGLADGAPSAGTAIVSGTGIATPLQVILPAATSSEVEVPVGGYTVTYTPPAGYTMARGDFNSVTINIVANEIVLVEFSIERATGLLRIGVTGVTAGAAGGGEVRVLRMDIPDQTQISVLLPVNGTAETGLTPGLYRLTYLPPANHELAAGQENPRQIDVGSSSPTATTFAAQASAAPTSGIIFNSDWSYALGISANAQRDGLIGGLPVPKWTFMGGSEMEVVPTGALGFPTANCLRVPYSPARFNFLRVDTLPVIAVGTIRTYRWYFRCDMPASDARISDWNFHPWQDGFAGSNCNWAFQTYTNHGTNWMPGITAVGSHGYPYNQWMGPLLAKGTPYRFELQFHRNTATTYRLGIRIFDMANVRLYDSTHFSNQARLEYNLETVRGNVPTTGDLRLDQPLNTNGFNAGTNDTYDLSPTAPQVLLGYEAGVAIADNTPDGWLGPYAGGI